MGYPAKKHYHDDDINKWISKLETEFRWCAQHPNDVSDIELEQLKQALFEFEAAAKSCGGKFYKDFKDFKAMFIEITKKPKQIRPGQFQEFEDMIQLLIKDLK
jgi:hypothetical protein